MRSIKLTIKGVPPSLNRFAGRENEREYRAEKETWTNAVFWESKRLHLPKPFERARVTILYYFPDNRRRDPDNYAGKMLLDGLTRGGVIVDDSFRHISLMLSSDIDREHPRTEILVKEV